MPPTFFSGTTVNSNRILYTPSEFAKTNLLHLQEIGTLHATKPHTSSRKGLSSYLFFVVTDGYGTLNYDGSSYELFPGSCVFIDCRDAYSHATSEQLWTLKWAHFYGPNMNGIYKKYVERGGTPCFTSVHLDSYLQKLDTMYEIAASSDHIKDMKLYEQLTSLLTLLMEDSWAPASENKHPTGRRSLQDVKEYIDLHFNEKILLDDLADRFYINKYYLTRVFKEQFGLSISHYIMQKRITHAKHLLRFSDHSIEQIASMCGMDDANYFSRVFRKIEGVSPGEFRRQW